MASNRISTLKGYFDAGDEPTAANFAEVMETIGNKYYNGVSAKTAGFTAENGYIYTIIDLDGCAVVLPTPVVGDCVKFVFADRTSNSHTITASATSVLFAGYAFMEDCVDGTEEEKTIFHPDESDDDVITLNGTTTGHSGFVELYATSTTRWQTEAYLQISGTAATPFS